jgi:tRNA (uracil-5-)-methyltransferase TRM9
MNERSTREVFNQLADGWYNTRHFSIFRVELTSLAARWKRGKLLNVGCGHGADFLPFKGPFELYGLDFSSRMIELARKYARKFEFEASLQVADARWLPYADNSFDWAISIAAYHHLPPNDGQLPALQELKRVLTPGGEAFLTVWNRCQSRFWFKGHEANIPWKVEGRTVYRYYYLFTFREFENLVKRAGFKVLKASAESTYHGPLKYFSRNICLLVKKGE